MLTGIESTQEVFQFERFLPNDSREPRPIDAKTYTSLVEALSRGLLQPDSNLLLTRWNDKELMFVTLQMVYYHVAQGHLDGEAWMLSFCAACNAGMLFSPIVNGRELHFETGGMYNAMLILRDIETGSLWNHITGEAVHGEMKGERLQVFNIAQHIRASQALLRASRGTLVYADILPKALPASEKWDQVRTIHNPYIERFEGTMGQEDTRLPRLDMGLGIWTDTIHRYYPVSQLYKHNNALIDTFDGRNLLVYIDTNSGNPTASFTTATHVETRGDEIYLDNGDRVRGGVLYNHDGIVLTPEQPSQLFIRWYGFSFVFPGCEIYGR